MEKLKNNRIVRKIFYRVKGLLNGKSLRKEAKKTIVDFGANFSPSEEKAIIADMVKTYSRFGFSFDEYLLYNFKNKSTSERLKFVADWEHLGYTCALNEYKNAELFDNKWKTYEKFKNYYGRKVVLCDDKHGKSDFIELIEKTKKVIIKPIDSSCGRGVKIIQLTNEISIDNLYNNLLEEYRDSFIVEELIKQDAQFAKFHPESVNTIRVPTIRMDDEVKIIHPFMRIGQNGSVVDNAGAGGIICSVDVETGELLSAADEKAKFYTSHPNSGEQIVGYIIPQWEQAKSLVKQLALIVPENRYTGWDITLTENGWIMSRLIGEDNLFGKFRHKKDLEKRLMKY